jgi:hypothetical protein
MEVLKTPDELTSPDPRHQSLLEYDLRAVELRQPIHLDQLHTAMKRLDLPESVPEVVRSAFSVARNLWLYGWFHSPLHYIAGSEAYRCMEMALIARCDNVGVWDENDLRRNEVRFSQLLALAIDRTWIVDEGFQNFHRIVRGEHSYFVIPGTILNPELYEPLNPSDPQSYSKQLFMSLRIAHDRRAHPDRYSTSVPSWSALELEIACDISRQLFEQVENR